MIRELPLGVYVPGSSFLHRVHPSLKFLLLVAFVLWVTIWPTLPWQSMAALTLIMVLYALAGIPVGVAWRQFVTLLPFLLFLCAFIWWQNGLAAALTTGIGLTATIAAANLLTLTTTVEALLDALDQSLQPLARVGVPVELISLTIALTIRLIPLMLATANEVLDARRARGAGFSFAAFGVPLVIRAVRRARQIGEALMARGAVD
ncbi:Energy-coupling factor transporter transmembrane protein BioN [Corynebacterium glaucum]|uniref:Energy-coupling factor transporter transmembrane protein BioN n=1 Tax=Corynebacterium glaucum TaxID=187491 RepID=A0A1Q2HXG2_9CORY|nr:energy-coupling factor transporter transmembrane component T [Corynebacterium glaucum]AQQ15460.1 Energy-coupling factor transporter transmembrane protein BioN [Corynebacterium glaucum]WJZ07960.1 Energy-coupling factor transporter transmembrane protein BioN [Corynebacterium glaucum]